MIKRNVVTLIGIIFASSVFAEVPVVDYSTSANRSNSSAIAERIEPVVAAVPATTAFSTSGLSAEQRVNRMEQQINNINEQNLTSKIDELQQRLQKLNGQVEDQAHQIEQLNSQLRNFYQDLNQRLEKSKANNDTAVVTANPSVVSTSNLAAVTANSPVVTPNTSATSDVSAASVTSGDIVEAVPADIKKNDDEGVAPRTDKEFLKEQQMYQTAIDLLPDKKYGASSSKLRDYLKLYPKGVYVANAHYWLGEINFLQKNYDAAEEEFKIIMDKYSKSKRVSDAMFKLALVHQQQGRDSQAKQELKQVMKRYPGTTAAQLAKSQLAGN
jgi:tol-pal system protein YbgF